MHTDKRLMRAYKKAKVEMFDKNSRYVFFSDLHRGDDSVSDEFSRNQILFLHALNYYNKNNYVYVELGDGDELWEYRDFKHIRLAHSDVFSTLKRFHDDNRLIILYGNHNIYLRNKQYVKNNYFYYYDEYNQELQEMFNGITPYEALVLKEKNTGQEIFAVHGHQGDLMNDQLWFVSKLMLRYFWRYLHVVGFHSPASPARNLYKRHKIERTYKKWIRKHKKALICGHTHRPRYPKKGELPYFNTGCCIHTKGLTGIEILGGKILMVDWRFSANQNGEIKINRTIKRGPEPVEVFDIDKG